MPLRSSLESKGLEQDLPKTAKELPGLTRYGEGPHTWGPSSLYFQGGVLRSVEFRSESSPQAMDVCRRSTHNVVPPDLAPFHAQFLGCCQGAQFKLPYFGYVVDNMDIW